MVLSYVILNAWGKYKTVEGSSAIFDFRLYIAVWRYSFFLSVGTKLRNKTPYSIRRKGLLLHHHLGLICKHTEEELLAFPAERDINDVLRLGYLFFFSRYGKFFFLQIELILLALLSLFLPHQDSRNLSLIKF